MPSSVRARAFATRFSTLRVTPSVPRSPTTVVIPFLKNSLSWDSGTRDAGLLHISGKPSAGVSLEQAEAAVRKELEELKSGFVGEQELEKVKNKFESTQIFGNINYLNVATNLAWFELTGQAEDIDREVDNYRSVTAEQLHTVAEQAFREENSAVLYYKKQN